MRLAIKSNAREILADLRKTERLRNGLIRKAFQRHGSRYIRTLVTRDLSGGGRSRSSGQRYSGGAAAGLHRVTGFAARSWNRTVVGRGSEVRLVVHSTAYYIAFHADDYTPLSPPRRFPVRVRSGKLWDDMSQPERLLESFEKDPVTGA